jgi:hypothetical protein
VDNNSSTNTDHLPSNTSSKVPIDINPLHSSRPDDEFDPSKPSISEDAHPNVSEIAAQNNIPISPSNDPVYPLNEKESKKQPPIHHQPQHQHQHQNETLHQPHQLSNPPPHTWSVDQVASWLASENISDNIIQLFKNELITGETLFILSKEDMGVIGIRKMGEKLLLVKLISELKDQWMMRVDGTERGVAGGGGGVAAGGGWGVEAGRSPTKNFRDVLRQNASLYNRLMTEQGRKKPQ